MFRTITPILLLSFEHIIQSVSKMSQHLKGLTQSELSVKENVSGNENGKTGETDKRKDTKGSFSNIITN